MLSHLVSAHKAVQTTASYPPFKHQVQTHVVKETVFNRVHHLSISIVDDLMFH
jgi:hypothetical protein